MDEIAALLSVGRTTLYERMESDEALKAAMEKGRGSGRATLRRLQWQKASAGSDTMLIWLGKQMLGQKDHATVDGEFAVNIKTMPDERLNRRLAELLGKAGAAGAARGAGSPDGSAEIVELLPGGRSATA
jgi:hypothetical protein